MHQDQRASRKAPRSTRQRTDRAGKDHRTGLRGIRCDAVANDARALRRCSGIAVQEGAAHSRQALPRRPQHWHLRKLVAQEHQLLPLKAVLGCCRVLCRVSVLEASTASSRLVHAGDRRVSARAAKRHAVVRQPVQGTVCRWNSESENEGCRQRVAASPCQYVAANSPTKLTCAAASVDPYPGTQRTNSTDTTELTPYRVAYAE